MTNEIKLLKAFIEASGYEIEEVNVPCMPVEAEGRFFGQNYKTDYKVTKQTKQDKLNQKRWVICDKCDGNGSHIFQKVHCDCSKCDGAGKVLI